MCDDVTSQFESLLGGRTDRALSTPPLTRADLVNDTNAALTIRLDLVLNDKGQYKRLLSLRGRRAQKMLDLFEFILEDNNLTVIFRRNVIVAMQRLSRTAGLFPFSFELRGVKVHGDPVAAGSFGDIYKGSYQDRPVCVKMIRLYQSSRTEQFMKQYAKEAILWSHLSHPNILPFYGLCKISSRPCFVSPWVAHGDVHSYLKTYPCADRLLLLRDTAEGLTHLHFYEIIHGDLKGANVLVNGVGRAYLADFGLSAVSGSNILQWTSHSLPESRGGSTRWQAPELFEEDGDENILNSQASDVYSWGCVCYEITTSSLPFSELSRDSSIISAVKYQGRQPSKPPYGDDAWTSGHLTPSLWDLMTQCWEANPSKRPLTPNLAPALYRANGRHYYEFRPLLDPQEIHAPRFRVTGRRPPHQLTVYELETLIFEEDLEEEKAKSYSDH